MHGQIEDPLDEKNNFDPDEIRFLASLAARAYRCVIRETNPIDLTTPGKVFRAPQNLRIAALAFEFPDPAEHVKEQSKSKSSVFARIGHKYSHVLMRNKGDNRGRAKYILERSESFLQACADRDKKPHFVLLNELALCFDNMMDLKERWKELAQRFACYIVPGTFHCTETSFSVAPILTPNGREDEVLKHNPARRQEERIRTPDSRSIQVFETDYGNIVVWICLDLYDPGLVFKFLSLTNRLAERSGKQGAPQDIHTVLVPSFNRDSYENISRAVRILTQFSHVPIVCSNSYTAAGGKVPRLELIARCGVEGIPDLTDSVVEWPPDGKSSCALFELDFRGLRDRMRRLPTLELPYSRIFEGIITGEGIRGLES